MWSGFAHWSWHPKEGEEDESEEESVGVEEARTTPPEASSSLECKLFESLSGEPR